MANFSAYIPCVNGASYISNAIIQAYNNDNNYNNNRRNLIIIIGKVVLMNKKVFEKHIKAGKKDNQPRFSENMR